MQSKTYRSGVVSLLTVWAIGLGLPYAPGISWATETQLWHQDTPGVPEVNEFADIFGRVLATGDFNGDGHPDLAIGAPLEDIGSIEDISTYVFDAGAVTILYGTPRPYGIGSRLSVTDAQGWHQDSPGMPDVSETADFFGAALATGDFNGDGYNDLAVGAPNDDVENIFDVGTVTILYGTADGLTTFGSQWWDQDVPGIPDANEFDNDDPGFGLRFGDHFGSALATEDFNGDGFSDLAVGTPSERIGSVSGAGAVTILYGSATGLTAEGARQWHQDVPGVPGITEAYDRFGAALTAGDFDGDGYGDLVVGAPDEAIGSISEAGAVTVLYGTASGITTFRAKGWHQDHHPISSHGLADIFDLLFPEVLVRQLSPVLDAIVDSAPCRSGRPLWLSAAGGTPLAPTGGYEAAPPQPSGNRSAVAAARRRVPYRHP